MQPCSNSLRAISNTAMSLARLAWDGNGSRRVDLWWVAAGGTRRGRERYIGAEPCRRFARIVGVGVETADMLVHEVLSRPMRDRRAVARYAGLTGSPDESGAQRREQGLARAGNARVR